MHWLTSFEEDHSLFDFCLENTINNCTLINNLDYYSGKLEVYQNDESCVFRGPFNLINKLKQKSYKNIWLGDEFLVSYYLPLIRNCLINNQYREVSLKALLKDWETHFWGSDKMFIRPDAYNKVFSGTVINKNDPHEFNKYLDFCQVDPSSDMLVYLAPYKQIDREYRFICSQKYVITGCQYMEKGEIKTKAYFPDEALRYVQQMNKYVSKIIPYPFYIIDLGSVLGSYGIVELNAFNTSGFYTCNLEYINKSVTKFIHNGEF